MSASATSVSLESKQNAKELAGHIEHVKLQDNLLSVYDLAARYMQEGGLENVKKALTLFARFQVQVSLGGVGLLPDEKEIEWRVRKAAGFIFKTTMSFPQCNDYIFSLNAAITQAQRAEIQALPHKDKFDGIFFVVSPAYYEMLCSIFGKEYCEKRYSLEKDKALFAPHIATPKLVVIAAVEPAPPSPASLRALSGAISSNLVLFGTHNRKPKDFKEEIPDKYFGPAAKIGDNDL